MTEEKYFSYRFNFTELMSIIGVRSLTVSIKADNVEMARRKIKAAYNECSISHYLVKDFTLMNYDDTSDIRGSHEGMWDLQQSVILPVEYEKARSYVPLTVENEYKGSNVDIIAFDTTTYIDAINEAVEKLKEHPCADFCHFKSKIYRNLLENEDGKTLDAIVLEREQFDFELYMISAIKTHMKPESVLLFVINDFISIEQTYPTQDALALFFDKSRKYLHSIPQEDFFALVEKVKKGEDRYIFFDEEDKKFKLKH